VGEQLAYAVISWPSPPRVWSGLKEIKATSVPTIPLKLLEERFPLLARHLGAYKFIACQFADSIICNKLKIVLVTISRIATPQTTGLT
jgi:hypothetical protein